MSDGGNRKIKSKREKKSIQKLLSEKIPRGRAVDY